MKKLLLLAVAVLTSVFAMADKIDYTSVSLVSTEINLDEDGAVVQLKIDGEVPASEQMAAMYGMLYTNVINATIAKTDDPASETKLPAVTMAPWGRAISLVDASTLEYNTNYTITIKMGGISTTSFFTMDDIFENKADVTLSFKTLEGRTDPFIKSAKFNVQNYQTVSLDDEEFTGIKLAVKAMNLPTAGAYNVYMGGVRLYDLDDATGAYTFCSVNTGINCDEIILCPKEKLAKGKNYKLVIPFESLYVHNYFDMFKEVCYFDEASVEFYTEYEAATADIDATCKIYQDKVTVKNNNAEQNTYACLIENYYLGGMTPEEYVKKSNLPYANTMHLFKGAADLEYSNYFWALAEGEYSVVIMGAEYDATREACYATTKAKVITFSVDADGNVIGAAPSAGASLVAGGKEIALSTETATEFGELPSGSVFKYTVTQADTKTVTFQIYDVTAGEILKSMTMKQDANGLSGSVEFSLAIKYELAKGHEYEAQFKEYNAVNGLTIKAPTVTANYKFAGQADVAVYSDIKVVSVSPSTSTDISNTENPIVITFSAPIASLSVKAIVGQMTSVKVSESNITSNEDKTVWTVALEEAYFSSATLQLNFYAIDNEGNRVTDPNNGVGTPESCYVNYSWASTYGLPTPKLAQDGKTYETISAIKFTNDGIGLNEDNSTATWQQITVEKDGMPMNLAITHDMFTIGGNASVGGTELTMALPTLYKGVYTVKVPARAFMLGHDSDNTYNGECTFTFTCTEEKPVPTELANVDFAEGVMGDVNIATYAKDGEVNQMQPVPGWSFGVENGDARAAGVVAYGSATTLGGASYGVPAAGPDGTNGNALAVVGVWTGTVQYVQDVKLPAGKYTMTVPVYNTAGTGAFTKNLIGVKYGETESYASATTYAVGKWIDEIVTFELEEETVVTVSLGYEGANIGSGSSQHLFYDCVKIEAYNELAVAKTAAIAALPAGNESIFTPSAEAVEAVKAAIEAATTVEEVENAAATEFAIPALEGKYSIYNTTAENYLGTDSAAVVLAAEPVAVTFEKAEGGFYIKAGEEYINMKGNNNWDMSADAEANTVWNFNLADGKYTIQGPKGMIGTDATEAGSYCYGDKNASKNGVWAIAEYKPVEPEAIDAIAADSAADGKYIEDGKVVIVKNGVKYNTAGQIIK